MAAWRDALRREGGPFAATVAFVVAAWGAIWHVGSLRDLSQPTEYVWDSLFVMGVSKSYGDRGLGALVGAPNPWLGAPHAAQWSDFPVEDCLYLGLGGLGRVVGTVAALNLAFVAAAALAGASLYLTARTLRIAPPVAMVAAAIFALAPFLHYRNINHYTLTVYWHLPLCVLVWLWTSTETGLRIGERRFWCAAAIATVTATLNAYYLNYFVQVLLLVGVVHLVQRRWRQALAAGVIVGLGMGVYLLTNLDTFVYTARHGRNPDAVSRSLADTANLALRPLELLVPGNTHRLFSDIGASYQAHAPALGEFPSNYLGIAGALCFALLVVVGLAAAIGRRKTDLRYLAFAGWLVFVAMDGGLMQLAQMATGFVAFRSNNRVSMFLLALAVLFAGRMVSSRLARVCASRRVLAWGVAFAIAALTAWEESPALAKRTQHTMAPYAGELNHWQMRERWARSAASDASLVERLESTLPEGAGIFQLPAVPFPEAGRTEGLPDYEPFRLYIHSHRKLRFSYGNMKGRPEASWQLETAKLEPPLMIARLREAGFRAIVLANAAYPEPAIASLRAAAGVPDVLRSDDGDYSVIVF